MSSGVPRRLVVAALAVAALIVACGFLYGALPNPVAVRQPASDADDPVVPTPRDPSIALRALGTHGHWGRYVPPVEQASTNTRPNAPSTIDTSALAQAYRLVGIEQRDSRRQAFLLPSGAIEGSDLIRLDEGDTLAEGVRVSAIGHDSVRFTTPGGNSTLYLYGTEP